MEADISKLQKTIIDSIKYTGKLAMIKPLALKYKYNVLV